MLAKGHTARMSDMRSELGGSIVPSNAKWEHAHPRLRHGKPLGEGPLPVVRRAAGACRALLLLFATSTAISRVLRRTAILKALPRALTRGTPAHRQSNAQAEQKNGEAFDHGLQEIQRHRACLRCMKTKKNLADRRIGTRRSRASQIIRAWHRAAPLLVWDFIAVI